MRAGDLARIATAKAVRAAGPGITHFATFDRTLSNTASVEGFQVISDS